MRIRGFTFLALLTLFLAALSSRCLAQETAEVSGEAAETPEMTIPQDQQTEVETPPETEGETPAEEVEDIAEEDILQITRQSRFRELKSFGHNMFDAAPSAFAPPTGVPVGPDYPLGPGDSLTIHIWGNKLLTSLIEKSVSGESNATTENKTGYRAVVSPQGNIFFPRIGVITVLGMTVESLERELERRLSEIYTGVKVSVMLASLRTITVFVIGEVQRPGGYSVNSLSTLFNALYVAGGPNRRGSMRDVKLIRNDQTLDTVDLYRYLLEGDKSQDYRLEGGDTIFVSPVGTRIAVAGEVLRPAGYEFKRQVTLKDVIETAGGILPSAYTQRIQVERVRDNKRKLFDIDASKLAIIRKNDIEMLDGDMIVVFSVLDIYHNRVTILGNVKRPGMYELKPSMRVSQLVEEAEGLLADTYLDRAEIYRLREDSASEVISINLADALSGKEDADVELQNLDKIFIYSHAAVEQTPYVRVSGQVKHPGAYLLTPGAKISDLIFKANGVKPKEAYLDRSNLFRLKEDGSVVVIPVNLKQVLDGDATEDILLEENDDLIVYSKGELNKIPRVEIQGAVIRPGTYALALNMRMKDLFFIAGGLTQTAYPPRAELIRTEETGEVKIIPFNPYSLLYEDHEAENLALQNYDRIIVYAKNDAERVKYVEIGGEVQVTGTYPLLADMTLKDLIFKAHGVKRAAYTQGIRVIRIMPDGGLDRLTVNLDDILNGDEDQNLRLRENDQVYVRRIPGWSANRRVKIRGEVMFAGEYTISEYETLDGLIKRAGGFKENAYKAGLRLERKSEKMMQYGLIGKNLTKLFERAEQDWYSVPVISDVATGTAGLVQAATGGVPVVEPLPSSAIPSEPTLISTPSELLPKKGEYVQIAVDVENMEDYILEDEDIIVVPKHSPFVAVAGEVYSPKAFTYKQGKKFSYYIELAGGYTEFADKGDQFILKANGAAVTKGVKGAKIGPGDLIVIPPKVKSEKTSTAAIIRDITSIVTSALTVGLIIVQLTK